MASSGAQSADLVIAQVNPKMPRTMGQSFIHVNNVDVLVVGGGFVAFDAARMALRATTADAEGEGVEEVGAGMAPALDAARIAARAGTDTATYAGDLTIRGNCDAPELEAIAWYCGNSGWKTRPVGGKRPNAWGLQDMLGNVWEWVEDTADSTTGRVLTPDYAESATDPLSTAGAERVIRGGAWHSEAKQCRSALRRMFFLRFRDFDHVGFRVVATSP